MLYLDLKYLAYIRGRLEGFTQKKDNVFNFRCPICGDSAKSKHKKRGYIFPWKQRLQFSCKNCGESHSFQNFLQLMDKNQYDDYLVELFKEKYVNSGSRRKSESANADVKFDIDEPEVVIRPDETPTGNAALFYSLCTPLDTLPSNNPAVAYCISRLIPKFQFKRLYYIDDMTKFNQMENIPEIKVAEPRLVIPMWSSCGKLIGLACRSLAENASLRYLNIKIDDSTQVFGLERVDPTKTIYVCEGPIDSLFLPNSIAVVGLTFGKIKEVMADLNIARDQMVIIIDNQPRNKEVCAILERLIKEGFTVVIWPSTGDFGKDINKMIENGITPREVFSMINDGACRGMEATLRFNSWKKVRK